LIENNIIGAMAVALLVSTVFLVSLRPVAIALGLVDRPGGRKNHEGNVPIIGGVAMFAGMFAGLLLVNSPSYPLVPLFVAAALILVVGVLDDRLMLPASVRLSAQTAAVLIMVYGAQLPLTGIGDPFGNGEIVMGRLTMAFTLLVTLTMINAYNLVDGVDGLAGSLALVALLAIAAAAGIGHPGAAMALTASAAIIGFLIFNFPTLWNRKTRTFMGDAGSTLLGFTIVWIALPSVKAQSESSRLFFACGLRRFRFMICLPALYAEYSRACRRLHPVKTIFITHCIAAVSVFAKHLAY
jgi:UDP-GlcNAc:undecaprenyl-phosphate GlcNAc-1-phosphate transferase